jgi:hypothetical protein
MNNNKTTQITNLEVLAVPSICELYPGICLTTERKSRRNLSQGSRRDSKNAHYQDTHTLQNPPIHKHTHKHKHTHTHIRPTSVIHFLLQKSDSLADSTHMV